VQTPCTAKSWTGPESLSQDRGAPPAEHVLSPLPGCPIRRPTAPDRLGCHADSPGQRGWRAARPARGIRTCPSSPSRAARVAISRCCSSEWDNQLSTRQPGLRVQTSSWNPKTPENPPSQTSDQSRSFKTILTCAAWPPDSCPNSMSGFRKPSGASGNWKPSESDAQSSDGIRKLKFLSDNRTRMVLSSLSDHSAP
jgi:hypothetical protein